MEGGMAFKSSLVPLEESEVLDSVLRTALLIARRHDSYIEGLCIRPTLAGAIAVDFEGGAAALSGTEEQFEAEQRERAARLRSHFDAFVAQNELPADSGGTGLGDRWGQDGGYRRGVLGHRGRAFAGAFVGGA